MPTNLEYLSLEAVAALLKRREISPSELVEAQLERVMQHDSSVNAFITVSGDKARRDALISERRIARGEYRGLLDGIPVAYKDNIETAGVRTTAHSRRYLENVPVSDAAVVERLNVAGAISLGKLALHELAYGSPTPDDPFPAARNPWDLRCSPGGSSSGCGAAVAGGFVYAAIGTDTGGSVRHPAAVCGLVGVKPTFDLVSTVGVIPLSRSQDHVGPLTRCVRDSAIVLDTMADWRRHAMPGRLLDGIEDGIGRLKIGVPRRFLEQLDTQADVKAAFDAALADLIRLGADMVDIDIPGLAEANAIGTRILVDEAYQQYGRDFQEYSEQFQPPFRQRVLAGAGVTANERSELAAFRQSLRKAYLDIFATGIDLVLMPGREEAAIDLSALMLDPFAGRGACTRTYNVTGLPALVLPMGFSSSHLPLSLQIAGPAFSEAKLYRAARAYEAATGWVSVYPARLDDTGAQATTHGEHV